MLVADRDLEHPVEPERAQLAALPAERPHPLELPAVVLHHLDGLGPDAPPRLRVVGLEIDDVELAARANRLEDHGALVGDRELFLGLLVLEAGQEADDPPVHADVALQDGRLEDDALERRAAAEGDVDLPVGERAAPDVDDDPVERLALALVDGDRPGQAQGILGERAHGFGLDPIRRDLVTKAEQLPGVGGEVDVPHTRDVDDDDVGGVRSVGGIDAESGGHARGTGGGRAAPALRRPSVNRNPDDPVDAADRAVDPATLAVVGQEHDLGARLELERLLGRQRGALELALGGSLVAARPAGQGGQLFAVADRGQVVRAGQRDVELAVGRREAGQAAAVEAVDPGVVDRAVADGVEEVDEFGVGLAIDLLQLDELHVEGQLAEDRGREEIWRFVAAGRAVEEAPLAAGDDGRELVEIADEDHLQPAEPVAGARSVEAEELLDRIEQVGPNHRDLVDDDGVEMAEDVGGRGLRARQFADGVRRDVGLEAEERMDGLAVDVEGGDAGRGQDGDPLLGPGAEIFEERGFPGAGLAGDEDVAVRVLHDVKGALKAGIDLDGRAGLFHQAGIVSYWGRTNLTYGI